VLLLAGCASAPPAPLPQPSKVVAEPGPTDLQRAIERRRAIARQFEQERALAAAAVQWQVVLLLAPNDREATERLGRLRKSIAAIVRDELAAGRNALRRGDIDQAQQALLQVLAVDGDNAEAIAELREIDRQRALQRAAARVARAGVAHHAAADGRGRRRSSEERDYDLEEVLDLLRAGDATAALTALRQDAAADGQNRVQRQRIAEALYSQAQQRERQGEAAAAADLYSEAIRTHPAAPRDWLRKYDSFKRHRADAEYDLGVRAMATDINAAIKHFEAALHYVPDHARAQLRLDAARRMQRNLRSLEPARSAN
jgi:tetratricopeptide (TPR) repeat protein